jgi:PAS domain S-box-containing protein
VVALDRYRRAVDAAQEIIWAHRDLHFVFVNPYAAKFVGQPSPEAMVGMPMLDFIHPDDRPTVLHRTKRFVEEGALLPPIDLRVRRGDGRYAVIEFRAFRFADEGGMAVMGIGRDITERADALAAAKRSEALLAGFMEHAPFAMFLRTATDATW